MLQFSGKTATLRTVPAVKKQRSEGKPPGRCNTQYRENYLYKKRRMLRLGVRSNGSVRISSFET